MNLFQAIGAAVSGVFQTAKRAQQERDQEGAAGRADDEWLAQNGYEAQYKAWIAAHGTPDGFVYRDPGNPPGNLPGGE